MQTIQKIIEGQTAGVQSAVGAFLWVVGLALGGWSLFKFMTKLQGGTPGKAVVFLLIAIVTIAIPIFYTIGVISIGRNLGDELNQINSLSYVPVLLSSMLFFRAHTKKLRA